MLTLYHPAGKLLCAAGFRVGRSGKVGVPYYVFCPHTTIAFWGPEQAKIKFCLTFVDKQKSHMYL